MRGTLPAVAVVAIWFGWLVGDLKDWWEKKKFKLTYFYAGLVLVIFSLVPSTLYEFYYRFIEQFNQPEPVFNLIDFLFSKCIILPEPKQ